jgi:carbamoyl-phosphate synthase/aspartate carbamoyltransferase
MASNFPIPPVAATGTAPAMSTGARIPIPAANATPLPVLSPRSPSAPHRPVTAFDEKDVTTATLVLQDGSSYQGISFGSEEKSISGECVFQTGKFFFFFCFFCETCQIKPKI